MKLYQLKQWLTIEETARHFSTLFSEPVNEADVLRLGLDRRLTLSVNFVNDAYGRIGNIVRASPDTYKCRTHPFSRSDFMSAPLWSLYCGAHGLEVPEDSELKLNPMIKIMHGVYDLFMLGSEAIDIENRWQVLAGGPTISKRNLIGVLVGTPQGEFCEVQTYTPISDGNDKPRGYLLNRANFSPAEKLPDDAMLVVRTRAIAEFEAGLRQHEAPQERPLSTTERSTLLIIIAALAEQAKIPISRPSKAADLIANLTQRLGAPVSKRSIEEKLKLINDAVQSRTKS